jgi:hypothetical protein
MECCCGTSPAKKTCCSQEKPAFPSITSNWTWQNYLGAAKARLFNKSRMNYSIKPGLFALGKPDSESDVFVSANYKYSFDLLRKALKGINAWILVLDTKGINVWCAAGKGSFGTQELIHRIREANLEKVVNHKKVIVPQLGAPNLKAHEVKKETAFLVEYGPVRAADIPAFLQAGHVASKELRTVKFPIRDRIILTPMEMVTGLKYLLMFSLIVFLLSGVSKQGILFFHAWNAASGIIIGTAIAFLAGTFFTPLLLPFIPARSFAAKGLIIGLIVSALFLILTESSVAVFIYCIVFMPALTSFLALNFTGASTYTNPSGVKKEMKIAIPYYLISVSVSLIALIVFLIQNWRK